METLDTLVDWATEEESGRWTEETLTSVLELVSGTNTLTGRSNKMTARNFNDKSKNANLIYTQNAKKKKLTTTPSELCPTWQSDSGACA